MATKCDTCGRFTPADKLTEVIVPAGTDVTMEDPLYMCRACIEREASDG